MFLSKSSVCILSLLVVSAASLQQLGKEITKEQWSPFDLFRSDPQPEERLDAKIAVKRASKHKHEANETVRYWELEDDSFLKPNQFCEESCTSSTLRVTSWESKCETTNCKGCEPCKEFQRNNASKYLWDIPPLGDRVPPRMLVSPGCDGSSAVLKHAHAILRMHGIKLREKGEVLGQMPYDDQVFIKENVVNRTLVETHEEFKSKKQTLLLRGRIGTDQETILSKDMLDLGSLVVQVSRRNLLDQAVCSVRDCFDAQMGHPVLRGETSDLCIKRRQAKDSWMKGQYKAFMNVNTLIASMQVLEDNLNQTANDLHNLGYTPALLKTEDLLDFEWSEDMMWSAVPAWERLLKSWGIEPDRRALVTYLRQNVGTREPPPPQEEAIQNFESVKEEIKNHARYGWMLRE